MFLKLIYISLVFILWHTSHEIRCLSILPHDPGYSEASELDNADVRSTKFHPQVRARSIRPTPASPTFLSSSTQGLNQPITSTTPTPGMQTINLESQPIRTDPPTRTATSGLGPGDLGKSTQGLQSDPLNPTSLKTSEQRVSTTTSATTQAQTTTQSYDAFIQMIMSMFPNLFRTTVTTRYIPSTTPTTKMSSVSHSSSTTEKVSNSSEAVTAGDITQMSSERTTEGMGSEINSTKSGISTTQNTITLIANQTLGTSQNTTNSHISTLDYIVGGASGSENKNDSYSMHTTTTSSTVTDEIIKNITSITFTVIGNGTETEMILIGNSCYINATKTTTTTKPEIIGPTTAEVEIHYSETHERNQDVNISTTTLIATSTTNSPSVLNETNSSSEKSTSATTLTIATTKTNPSPTLNTTYASSWKSNSIPAVYSENLTTTEKLIPTSSNTTVEAEIDDEHNTTNLDNTTQPVEVVKNVATTPATTKTDTMEHITITETTSYFTTNAHEQQCGITQNQPYLEVKIVGGEEAVPHSWPWQVALLMNGRFYCGGSLIDQYHIITAAHCVTENPALANPANWLVWLGKHILTSTEPNQLLIGISSIKVNPAYNSDTVDSDIAIMTLKSPAPLNSTSVAPICLPDAMVPDETLCWTTGWGDTKGTGDNTRLQQVELPIVNLTLCNSSKWYNGKLTENMICAGYADGTKDTCSGDSGGPLACLVGTKWTLIGVTSFGAGCGVPLKPGVYTRVTEMLPFIESVINNSTTI